MTKYRMNNSSFIFLSWFLASAAALTQPTTTKQTTALLKYPSFALPSPASLKRTGLCMSNSFHTNEVQRSSALLPALMQQQRSNVMNTRKNTSIRSTPTFSDAMKADDRKKRLAAGMAFITGWAQVTLFLKYKTFATMMTGNTMWMARAAVEMRGIDVLYYMSMIFSYTMGLATFRKADLELREKSLRLCALIVFALFAGSDIIHAVSKTKWMPLMMLSTGFGIVNSIGNEIAGTLTFVITGHLTRLTNHFVDRISSKTDRKTIDKSIIIQNASVLGGFFMGAAWGCSLIAYKEWLTVPWSFSLLGFLYSSLFYWKDMEDFGGAWWLRENDAFCDVDDDGSLCGEEPN